MSQGVDPIGTRIRDYRKVLGLSQQELSNRAGVTVSLISKVEQGRITDLHLATLEGVARSLNISVAELLGEETAVPLAQAPSPPETTEDAEELDDDPESLRRKNELLMQTIDYQRNEMVKPLRSRVEELEAENERLKKVLKSGLVEKMVAADAGVPSRTEGGRRMAYCHSCGWWLVAEAREVMEAWGNEKGRTSEEGGDG